MSLIDRALRVGEGKKFKDFEKNVARINDYEPELELESDEELRARYDDAAERGTTRASRSTTSSSSASRSPARRPSARSASATSTSS